MWSESAEKTDSAIARVDAFVSSERLRREEEAIVRTLAESAKFLLNVLPGAGGESKRVLSIVTCVEEGVSSMLSTAIEGLEYALPANDFAEESGCTLSLFRGSLVVESDCSLCSLNCSL